MIVGLGKWLLLAAATVAVTVPLTKLGVPSAALFAGLVVGIALALSPASGRCPGGIYAVLATAVEAGSNVTFIVAVQVIRVLLMLFGAPLLARAFLRLGRRPADQIPASSSASREPIRVAD